MRALFLISVIGLFAVSQNWMSAQSVYSPYTIIYIHGLDSEDSTWHETIAALRELHGDFTGYNSQNPGNVFNAMLNRYQDMIEGGMEFRAGGSSRLKRTDIK
ncbi:MAG: hypothetical protein IPG73_13785 [Ignavibacteria bacterium]|nr:hypothetical protein [Ignavibacteria bacterium]